MKVFADFHHGDLYYSLHLLFVKRLGGELYRPIGLDWFNDGFWKIAEPYGNSQSTINQYLAINNYDWNLYKTPSDKHYVESNIYHMWDPGHDYYQKAITLETFKDMRFDLILPTIESHEAPYKALRDAFQPQAAIVSQMGNTGQKSILQHVMHTTPYNAQPGQNTLFYHQEIDTNLYKYVEPNPNTKNIYSVVNCFPRPEIYNTYKSLITNVNWKAYGGGCPDGSLMGAKGVAKAMQESNLGWHCKPMSGYGHSSMGWFYSGRPVVTTMSDVRAWTSSIRGLEYWEPGVTCINIEEPSVENNCRAIRQALIPENNIRLCENAKRRFHEIINYDQEEQNVRKFLERIFK